MTALPPDYESDRDRPVDPGEGLGGGPFGFEAEAAEGGSHVGVDSGVTPRPPKVDGRGSR